MAWDDIIKRIMRIPADLLAWLRKLVSLYHLENLRERGLVWAGGLLAVTLVVFLFIVGIFWSQEPDAFDVRAAALEMANGDRQRVVPGFTTAATLAKVTDTLLTKPGGYLSNDVLPPSSLFGIRKSVV